MCFSLVRGWQCSPRKWNQGLWDIGTSLNSLLCFMLCPTGQGGYRKHCHAHPPASLRLSPEHLSDSTASLLSSLLATPTHSPSHSRCWNSLPFLMRVPECLIKVVQPSKSESFTVGRSNIYSNQQTLSACRGRHCWSLGHREHVIGQHETALASDCSCYSQTSHSQWQYTQCFIQCQLKR